jgi:hypothetical protein
VRDVVAKRGITLRIGPAADEWIGKVAEETGAKPSLVTRSMLAVATEHRDAVMRKVRVAMEAEGERVGRD